MPPPRGLAVLLLALLLSMGACATADRTDSAAASSTTACTPLPIRVEAVSAEDAESVCAAAREVSAFFRGIGLSDAVPLSVSVVGALPPAFGCEVLGCFVADRQQVVILSRAAARGRGPWLGVEIDQALYRSIASHEITHALALHNAAAPTLSRRAREYVSYVVMFATMDAERRGRILGAAGSDRPRGEWELSTSYALVAPHAFGIDAYRHHLQPGHGVPFLLGVLRGQRLQESDD